MSKELLRTRIGNTVTVVLPVLTRGDAVSLVGRDITIMLVDPNDVKTPVSFTIGGVDNNIATFVVEGTSQSATGTYRAEVYENYRGTAMAVYDCDIFVLVARTEYENDGNEGVSSETTTLDPINIAWVGRDGYTPYIQDGYWYINGTSTNVKAAGENGDTPYIENGYWYIGGISTGIKVDYTNEEAQRAASEQVRVVAEAARVQAEAARTLAENSRLSEESGRSAAEANRILAERDRQSEEAMRQTNEEIRTDNEEARVEAELGRAASEASRAQVEATRVANETARTTAEATRAANEQTRTADETDRTAAETARIAAETARETAEGGRTSAEATRVTNEQTRVSNETTRQSNESARQAAETARQSAYTAAENARDAAFAAKEATRDAANQAALDCADTLAALGPKIDQLDNKTIKLSGIVAASAELTDPQVGDIFWSTYLHQLRVILTVTPNLTTDEVVPDDASVFIYNDELYVISGNKMVFTGKRVEERLDWTIVKVSAWGTTSGLSVGEVAYNTSKILRKKVGASSWVTIPYTSGLVVAYNNEFYKWNGSDLVNINADLVSSVTRKVEKLAGKNIYTNTLAAGWFDANGAVSDPTSTTNSHTEDYMPVSPSTAYHLSRNGDEIICYGTFGYGVWYDADHNIISTFLCNQKDVTSPATAAYMRVTVRNEYNNKVQIEQGSARTDYQAYNPIQGYVNNLPAGTFGKEVIKASDIDSTPTDNSQKFVTSGGVKSYVDKGIENINYNKVTLSRKNLFDLTKVTTGKYIKSDGSLASHDAYGISAVIPIKADTDYHLSCSMTGAPDYMVGDTYEHGIYYLADGTKTFFQTNATNLHTPVGCEYIQFSFVYNRLSTIQLEEGTARTDYESFLSSDLGAYIANIFQNNPELFVDAEAKLPRQIFVIKGEQNSLYHTEYCRNYNGNDIYPDKAGGPWSCYDRYWRIQASETPSGNLNFTLRAKRTDAGLRTFNIPTRVGDKTNTTNNIKVNIIGDSFCYGGHYIKQIADCCGNADFVGMRKTQYYQLYCEGRGGWKMSLYYDPKSPNVTLAGMDSFSPFMHASGYRYYGVKEFWASIVNNTSQYAYGTDGFDKYVSWFDTNGRKANPSVNDLMYNQTAGKFEYWDGSTWTQLSTAPTFAFDYAKYIDIWQIDSPDFVVIQLGTNDFYTSIANMTTWFNRMDELIASINAYAAAQNKTIDILICTAWTASGAANNSSKENPTKRNHNYYDARKAVIEKYDTQANYDDNHITVVDTGVVVDDVYGYHTSRLKPFDYFEGDERELYDWNGVHPDVGGYKQFGNPIAGAIQYLRT